MKFTSTFVAAILSTVALAAPASNAEASDLVERQSGAVSMMAAVPQWTIQNM